MRLLIPLFLAFLSLLPCQGQLETRVYSFTNMPPAVVEQTVLRYVPARHRVKLNPEHTAVMVIADLETHEQLGKVLQRMDQPRGRLRLWSRVGGSPNTFLLENGELLALPLTRTPDPRLVEQARARLPGALQQTDVQGSALEIQVNILKEAPLSVRLRVTPVLAFGRQQPYTTIRYSEYSTDLLLRENLYLSLGDRLGSQALFRPFFRSASTAGRPPEPFDVLLALEGMEFGERGNPGP